MSDGGDLAAFYRAEFGRALSAVIRAIGDFHLAEESVQEAFAAAFEAWPRDGWPRNPLAWLVSTARNKAIDSLRRAGRWERIREELGHGDARIGDLRELDLDDATIADERLRLIFTCCHPALALDAQVALALRTLCGLTTEEIARAFLLSPATLAQRLVRAKRKLADARIPFELPAPDDLPERLAAVMTVVYLVFNEGYGASAGDSLLRRDLSSEAIRLGRLLAAYLPTSSEVRGLLALMLLNDSRRDARTTPAGDLVLLEDQDRSRWHRPQIAEGLALAAAALAEPPIGPYALQAAIAAEHARAPRADATDWRAIARRYDALARLHPSPVIALNRAIAIAMRDGPGAGLEIVTELARAGGLEGHHLLWATQADLLRRLERFAEAASAYRRALALVGTEPERRYLAMRLREVEARA